jgi:hypothetical protein
MLYNVAALLVLILAGSLATSTVVLAAIAIAPLVP